MIPGRARSSNYEPFGPSHGESDSEEFRYTGKREDQTGLYYYGARYYHPETGRFITEDPVRGGLVDPQSLNRYVYCVNNPYKYTDPNGKEPNRAKIGPYEDIYESLKRYEDNHPGAKPKEVLKSMVALGRFNFVISKHEYTGPEESRYVYTEQDYLIDNHHFFSSALTCLTYGPRITRELGYIVEDLQKGFGNPSAYSYEDLPSNELGIQFAMTINNDESLAEQYKLFMDRRGASNDPKVDYINDHSPARAQKLTDYM